MLALPRPQAILFDLGDTLLTEEAHDLSAGLCALLSDPELPTLPDPESGERLASELSSSIERTRARPPEEFSVRDWLGAVLAPGSGKALLQQAEHRFFRGCARLSPAPGVHDLLDELAAEQVPLAAVSNAIWSSRVLAAELERHGLRRSFATIVSSADLGIRKPDPAPFHQALRRFGVEAVDAWYVGDSFGNDVVGAVGAGLSAVWLDASDAAAPGSEPHQRIRSLTDLIDLQRQSAARPDR